MPSDPPIGTGREVDAAPYYAQADATIDASNTATFTLETPVGVGFDAESAHDYTAVPEAAALDSS